MFKIKATEREREGAFYAQYTFPQVIRILFSCAVPELDSSCVFDEFLNWRSVKFCRKVQSIYSSLFDLVVERTLI